MYFYDDCNLKFIFIFFVVLSSMKSYTYYSHFDKYGWFNVSRFKPALN